jgi:purine nucleosidase
MKLRRQLVVCVAAVCMCGSLTVKADGQQERYVIIDQDASGPATTDTNSIALFLQFPNVNVLGITVVTGDQWRDEEVAHTLRLLELMGRTDIPVVPGVVFPFVFTKQMAEQRDRDFGYVIWKGVFNAGTHAPSEVPELKEGNPTTKPADEDAAHFMIRMVHKYPHQVTIYAGGPLMNIATAIILDPDFATLAKELVIMGGSINPQTDDPEYIDSQRREFNFWFDPEATSIVFHAPWPNIIVTTVDVSIETHLTKEMIEKLNQTHSAAAQYVARYSDEAGGYLWDELAAAAWFDPTLITRERNVYMDVSLDKGMSYGDTLVWTDKDKPDLQLQKVHAQMDVDWPRFQAMFMGLMSSPTPGAKNPQILSGAPPKK